MAHRSRSAAIALGLGLLAACGSARENADDSAVTAEAATGPLGRAFDASAARAGVPRDLLVAIARVEDGLSIPAERLDLDVDNDVPAAGPLQLRRGKLDTLARGAALARRLPRSTSACTRISRSTPRRSSSPTSDDRPARAPRKDLATWNAAIEEMSGFADEAAPRALRASGLRDARARRSVRRARRRDHRPAAPRSSPSLTLDVSTRLHTLATSQYPAAEWIPTSCANKCTAGRDGNAVQFVVVHDTEGGWNASVATLQNDPDKSVQYIVGTDGKVGQFVTEETTAWHAGNFHFNQRSVGIEHVGYATKPFAEAEYAASAKLVDYLTKKYEVPRDRAHIIGHDQIPNGDRIAQSSAPCDDAPKACQKNLSYGGAAHHTDPGVWEWPTFMRPLRRRSRSATTSRTSGTAPTTRSRPSAARAARSKSRLRRRMRHEARRGR